MRHSILFVLASACLAATAPAAQVIDVALAMDSKASAPARLYAQMSKAKRVAYVEARAREVSAMLSDPGGASIAITPDAIRLIQFELDSYIGRVDSDASQPWRESMGNVLARGAANAPAIRRAFEAEGVPVVAGLYLAMIESEYNACLESPMGARGMFQFLPKTGSLYGVAPEELCDLEKAAPAAARYIRDRRAEFGTDPVGSVLALLSYNQGQGQTRQVFQTVLAMTAPEEKGQELWSVLARPEEKGATRDVERTRYVPRFFAATIIGENPADFGIQGQPLSAH
jgi:soluble lytic murein transglycosylase-like protein